MGRKAWGARKTRVWGRWRAFPYRVCYSWCGLAAIAAMLAAVTGFVFAGNAGAAPIDPSNVHVIDGDTIRLHRKKPNVRLVGFNAPETRRAACDAEREVGGRATHRLRDIVRAGNLDFGFVACACAPGTEGSPVCNYGRRCGTLKANGRDVGAILTEEGLAVPFVCGLTRCPRTPRPWCD